MTACTMCSHDGESSPRAPAARVEQAAAASALETRVSGIDIIPAASSVLYHIFDLATGTEPSGLPVGASRSILVRISTSEN